MPTVAVNTSMNPAFVELSGALSTVTLAQAYANGVNANDNTMRLTAAGGGVRIFDNAAPLAVSLFAVASSGGQDYLKVQPSGVTALAPLKAPFPDAADTDTLILGDVANGSATLGQWWQMTPGEAGASKWYGWLRAAANAGAQKNQTVTWGFNMGQAGSSVDVTLGAVGDGYESRFEPVVNDIRLERHMQFVKVGGTLYRFFSSEYKVLTDVVNAGYNVDSFQFASKLGVATLVMYMGPSSGNFLDFQGVSGPNGGNPFIQFEWKNGGPLRQLNNNSSGYTSLVNTCSDPTGAVAEGGLGLAPDGGRPIVAFDHVYPDADNHNDIGSDGAGALQKRFRSGYFSISIETPSTRLTATKIKNLLAANEVATVGAAGGAAALPATPLGYLRIELSGGGAVNVPYYNT